MERPGISHCAKVACGPAIHQWIKDGSQSKLLTIALKTA